jgi:MFS family permease
LPTISEHFGSAAGFTWIGSAYLLGAASSTPIWAKFSDIFGRKPILMSANIVFFVGSLVAALSKSIGMLIAARAVQGIGGGGLITLVSVSIGDLFSMRYVGRKAEVDADLAGCAACTTASSASCGPSPAPAGRSSAASSRKR